MFHVRSPYPWFVLALILIIVVCLNPRSSVKAAEPNGGQQVACTGAWTNQGFLEGFLRDNPNRRIVAFTTSGTHCIVHEPVAR